MKTIISASRRTDIPAFHYDWFKEVLKEKEVKLFNKYSLKDYTINLDPKEVHSIVLWSKNFINVINDPEFLDPYNLFFHFTINDYGRKLEPCVPDADEQVKQMELLSKKYSPEQIQWRFDPLIFFEDEIKGKACNGMFGTERLRSFEILAEKIGQIGVTRCTLSLFSPYEHSSRTMKKNGFKVIKNPENDSCFPEFLEILTDIAKENNIQLFSCATPVLEANENIKHGCCIDGKLLTDLFGEKATGSKDTSQREVCGCVKSKDIGSYNQICKHNCLYCYSQVQS